MKKIIYVFVLLLSIIYSSNIYSQCVTGDCNNGEGTYIYSDSKYWGNWMDGKREGYGVFTLNDNSGMYKGNWFNDKKMVSDLIIGVMGVDMKGIGWMAIELVKVHIIGKMEIVLLVNFLMAKQLKME